MLEFLKAVISSIFSLFLVLVFTFLSFIQNLSIPYQDDDFQIQSQQPNIYDYDDSFELIRDEDAYQTVLNDVNALRKKCFYGTNQYLSGKVTAVVIYMNDFESSWTDEQMDEFTEKDVEPALAFLEQGAEKYGVELDFETKILRNAYYDDEVIIDIDASGFTTIDVLEQAAESYDFDSQYDIHDWMVQECGTEVLFITVFNKPGCGYALNPKPGTDFRAVEHCILFSIDKDYQTEYEPGTNAPVIVSTTLHLFGGESLNKPEGRKVISQMLYPNDIMRIQPFDIAESDIGEATAYYIGWTDVVPESVYSQGWNEYE